MRTVERVLRIGLLAVILAPAGVAGADEASAACAEDVKLLCPTAGETLAARMQCLRANEPELSDACRQTLGSPAQLRSEVGDACGDDAVRFCAGTQPGRHGTGMLNCLRDNATNLTDECRMAVDALPGRKREGAASQM